MIKRLNRPRSFGPTTKLSSFLRTFSLSPLLCLMIIYPTKRHWNWNALTLIFHFKSLQCEKLLQHFFWTAWLALYWQHSPVSPPLAAQTLWNGSSLSGECELWTIIIKLRLNESHRAVSLVTLPPPFSFLGWCCLLILQPVFRNLLIKT